MDSAKHAQRCKVGCVKNPNNGNFKLYRIIQTLKCNSVITLHGSESQVYIADMTQAACSDSACTCTIKHLFTAYSFCFIYCIYRHGKYRKADGSRLSFSKQYMRLDQICEQFFTSLQFTSSLFKSCAFLGHLKPVIVTWLKLQ